MSEEPILDYEQLYDAYQRGLVDTLRGFGPAQAYLALWVPDEEPLNGLRNMLDAAASAGQPALVIRLGRRARAGLSREQVLSVADPFGSASLREEQDGEAWLLRVEGLREVDLGDVSRSGPARGRPVGAEPRSVTSPGRVDVYAQSLAAPLELGHAGVAAGGAEPATVTVEREGVRLALWIDRAEAHRIVAARFETDDAGHEALMERFCRVLEGLPMQEASDHGVARLERALRPDPDRRPVPGIVTPRSAHPRFALPTALIRRALARYRDLAGYRATHNVHDDRPAEAWLQASDEERHERLEKALAPAARRLGGAAEDVRVHAVQHDVRVVLEVRGALDGPHKPRALMLLERALKDEVDPRLEVFLKERKDENQLRRLAVVGGT